MIRRQKDPAGIVDDGAGGTHLTIVEVQQRTVQIDAANTDDAVVHLELVNEIDGGLTDDAAIAAADQPPRHDHLEIGIPGKDQGHVEVVGDHAQSVVVEQGLGHLLGGGADIDEQGGAIGDFPREAAGDLLLFGLTDHLAMRVGHVLDTGGDPGTAMVPLQLALLIEVIDVSPNRLRRHGEALGQLLNGHIPLTLHQAQNLGLPLAHAADLAGNRLGGGIGIGR